MTNIVVLERIDLEIKKCPEKSNLEIRHWISLMNLDPTIAQENDDFDVMVRHIKGHDLFNTSQKSTIEKLLYIIERYSILQKIPFAIQFSATGGDKNPTSMSQGEVEKKSPPTDGKDITSLVEEIGQIEKKKTDLIHRLNRCFRSICKEISAVNPQFSLNDQFDFKSERNHLKQLQEHLSEPQKNMAIKLAGFLKRCSIRQKPFFVLSDTDKDSKPSTEQSEGSARPSKKRKIETKASEGASIVKKEDALSLADGTGISRAYASFQKTKDLSQLTQATENLNRLTSYYKQLWTANRTEEALEFKKQLDIFTKMVQEMNLESPILTIQDLQNVNSFFSPPVEQFYIDEKSGIKYHMPNHSKLFNSIFPYFKDGEYMGTGISRNQTRLNLATGELQKCDVAYLTKKADQIAFENGDYDAKTPLSIKHGLIAMCWPRKEKIQGRLVRQETCAAKASTFLKEKIKEWNYDSFAMCEKKQLLTLGWDELNAKQIHAVVLYHKKWKTEGEKK